MHLEQLARCMRAYLSPDFTTADRVDIRKYALFNLEQRGIDTFHLRYMDLVDLTVAVEKLTGERVPAVAA